MLIELPGFASGKLDAVSRLPVRAHLQSCEACRKELAEIERLDQLLNRALPVITPSPTFASTFANRLAAEARAEEEAERGGWLGWLVQPWLIPVAAAVLLAAVMLPPWFSSEHGSTSLSLPRLFGNGGVASNKKAGEPKVVQADAPPSDLLQRPELFVDYSVIRDLDILDTESHAG
jgi:anti-sigma factor RsiW